jgi:hypothetical protein
MALKRDFYKTLEDILNPQYVSDDLVITETYATPIRAGMSPETYAVIPRFEAVALPKNEEGSLWRFIRITGSIRETSPGGGFRGGGAVGDTDVFTLMSYFIKNAAKIKEDFIRKGMLFDDGTSPFIQSIEHGHTGHGEVLNRISMKYPKPLDIKSEGCLRVNKLAIEGHFGVPHYVHRCPPRHVRAACQQLSPVVKENKKDI